MTDKISGDGVACVDHSYYWRSLTSAPHGVKVQLLSKFGVAVYGVLTPATIAEGFWIAWAPLPKKGSDLK